MAKWILCGALIGVLATSAVFLSLPHRTSGDLRGRVLEDTARDLASLRAGLDRGEDPTYACAHFLSVARELSRWDDPRAAALVIELTQTCELEAPLAWADWNLRSPPSCNTAELTLDDLRARGHGTHERVAALSARYRALCR